MKLLEKTISGYKFESGNGATWTRQHLVPANYAVEIHGWKHSRNLYLPSDDDAEFFPLATFRIELSTRWLQESPLFTSAPCRIKPGTKNILQIFDEDDIITEVRIKKHFDFRTN